MKVILAVDKNWGIGKDNQMLFHISRDLKHFRYLTYGNIVIMGRNTYESMGKALRGRENLVLTRNKNYKLNDARVFFDYKDLLAYIKNSKKEVFVIGGKQIVDLFLPFIDEAIITKIFSSREADTFLHNFDEDPDFKKIDQSEIYRENEIDFRFVKYRRK